MEHGSIDERVAKLENTVFGERLLERVSDIEHKTLSTTTSTVVKPTSIREFVISKRPENDVEKTVTITYYLEIYGSVKPVNTKDIQQGFLDFKEKPPGNINDKVNKCISRGFLMKSSQKDNISAWELTNTGIAFIENELPIKKK